MTPDQKRKVLLVSSQPIQNTATLRLMAERAEFDVLTAYCSLPDAKLWRDDEHLNKQAFETSLDGYKWKHLANWSPFPSLAKFYGLINPGVVREILKVDCVVVYGHSYITFWLAMATAKLIGKPLILTTDATSLNLSSVTNWKSGVKKRVLPFLYNHIARSVLVPSSASGNFLQNLGVEPERIAITPYVVDNDVIGAIAATADKSRVKRELEIPVDAKVVAFCAKFIPRKRPADALRAFARAAVPGAFLIMIGDGPLAESLRNEAEALGIKDRVRFTGLVKYSKLPELYTTADVLLLTSEFEPYGLPVNESMISGTPVIASDRVGAARDLIREGETGFTYECGNIDQMASRINETLSSGSRLKELGNAAQNRMKTWSPRENASATLSAVQAVTNPTELGFQIRQATEHHAKHGISD